jgi:uncharacterized protein
MKGRVLADGAGEGPALVLEEPLSFWGGVDPASGMIIDARHPQRGTSVKDRVVVMRSVRGSSSSSSVLAESVRAGFAPAAILLGEPDLILAVGAAVADELYGRGVAIVQLDAAELGSIPDGARVAVSAGGEVTMG